MDTIFEWLGHATCSAASGIGLHTLYNKYCVALLGTNWDGIYLPNYRSVGQVVFFGLVALTFGGLFTRPQTKSEHRDANHHGNE